MVMNYQIISFLSYCNKTTGQWIKIIFHMAEQMSLAEFDQYTSNRVPFFSLCWSTAQLIGLSIMSVKNNT